MADRQALLDAGQKIWVLDNREAGNRLEVTGSEEFKKTAALTAAKHGLQMQFREPSSLCCTSQHTESATSY